MVKSVLTYSLTDNARRVSAKGFTNRKAEGKNSCKDWKKKEKSGEIRFNVRISTI